MGEGRAQGQKRGPGILHSGFIWLGSPRHGVLIAQVGPHYVAQAGAEFKPFLFKILKCWDYKCEPKPALALFLVLMCAGLVSSQT